MPSSRTPRGYITAKIRYKSADGAERRIEVGDTRYAVVFTGETLPDGRTADAVYIVLHDFYREILDHALTRPLDYDYLKDLPPAAQRLYEVVSYAMFAALKNNRPRARLAYSEFCRLAPLTRHFEWERARVQMAKIHTPHRKSGYLAGVEFEATTDREGRPDWTMVYEPGPKAKAEHLAFTTRGGPVVPATRAAAGPARAPAAGRGPADRGRAGTDGSGRGAGGPRRVACRGRGAGAGVPGGRLRRQIEVLDWLRETKPKRIKDVGAYLAKAIRKDFAAPAGFKSQAERAEAEATVRARREREEQARRRRPATQRGAGPDPRVLGGADPRASSSGSRPRRWPEPNPPTARRTRERRRRRSRGCSWSACATPGSDACSACPRRIDRRAARNAPEARHGPRGQGDRRTHRRRGPPWAILDRLRSPVRGSGSHGAKTAGTARAPGRAMLAAPSATACKRARLARRHGRHPRGRRPPRAHPGRPPDPTYLPARTTSIW